MGQLATILGTMLDRNVVDETKLQGDFDLDIKYLDSQLLERIKPEVKTPDVAGISLFDALQEQVGLRLTSGKGLVDVIVVDGAEKPSAN
jgi:uncharacterized protein (TIGR03435 family)